MAVIHVKIIVDIYIINKTNFPLYQTYRLTQLELDSPKSETTYSGQVSGKFMSLKNITMTTSQKT